MDIIEAITSDKLFKPVFKDLDTWGGWITLLRVFFGLSLSDADLTLYKDCTGRETAPGGEFKELWAIVGRRGGKSFMAAVMGVYLALFHKYADYLVPGERGVVQIIAADRKQAGVILRYIKGVLNSAPVFSQYIEAEYRERVDLTNGISIEVMTCSFRSIRGRTVVCAVFDEIAFWMSEGANPDRELLSAIRPSMATILTSKLIVISSPYARHGVLYEQHRDYYGTDDDEILIWQAPTRTMNPTISEKLIHRELVKDPSAGRSEWYALFREDIETFLSPDAIFNCVIPGRRALPPQPDVYYSAFVDPSGGRHDAFTLSVGHNDQEKYVIDLLKAWKPPFDPAQVVEKIAEDVKPYNINSVTGDRYAAAWVSTAFEKVGLNYQNSEMFKSDLYLNFEPKINTGQVELVDDEYLIKELCALERRTGRSGKDSVDHGPRGSDDRANAVAGVVSILQDYEEVEIGGFGTSIAAEMAADPCFLHYGRE